MTPCEEFEFRFHLYVLLSTFLRREDCSRAVQQLIDDANTMGSDMAKKLTKAGRKVKLEMGKWKAGTLHSGSKKGPVVSNQKQAVAISLSVARRARRR